MNSLPSAVRPSGSIRRLWLRQACLARSWSSTSAPIPASTGCARFRMCALVTEVQAGSRGLGVHTPEFAFEKNLDNVRRAVQQMKIDYPIVIDNDYSIWRAFKNQYWPALYFVDARGGIRDHHFGEGEYERSERVIQRLLADAGVADAGEWRRAVTASGVEAPADWPNLKSPENYLGLERTQNFASPGGADLDRSRVYAAPGDVAQSVGAYRRLDDWQSGSRAEQGRRPNRVPLSLARSSSRDGSVTTREPGTLSGIDRRTTARRRSRHRRGRRRQRYGRPNSGCIS